MLKRIEKDSHNTKWSFLTLYHTVQKFNKTSDQTVECTNLLFQAQGQVLVNNVETDHTATVFSVQRRSSPANCLRNRFLLSPEELCLGCHTGVRHFLLIQQTNPWDKIAILYECVCAC